MAAAPEGTASAEGALRCCLDYELVRLYINALHRVMQMDESFAWLCVNDPELAPILREFRRREVAHRQARKEYALRHLQAVENAK